MAVNIKTISLAALVVQSTALVLLLKHSRTVEGPMYLASTAVVLQELLKLGVCLFLLLRERSYNFQALMIYLREEIFDKPKETLKLGVPACLYTFQANLLYLAISNLDAATFQVTYQLKILTTAFFSVAMLGKQLSSTKWAALVLLMLGVALVQMPSGSPKDPSETEGMSRMTGLLAVVTACISSGFAGIYFEKLLKDSTSDIWLKNVQLGAFGFVLGLAGSLLSDGDAIAKHGFFTGYSWLVVLVVVVNAAGGLVIAIVIKYADNIVKAFATSVAIILSSILSVFFFDFHPSNYFLMGSLMVVGAVSLYSRPDPQPVALPLPEFLPR